MRSLTITAAVLLIAATLTAQGWGPDVRLTNDPAESKTSPNNAWCVAASGNNIHVVWSDNRDGDYELYYKRYFPYPNIAPLAEVRGTSLNPGGGRDVDKLNDESFSGFWESASTTGNVGDVWMQYEWDIPYILETSVFYCSPSDPPGLNLPIEYNIEAWIDGQWQEIAHIINTDSSKSVFADNLQDVTTTKVRINLIDIRDTGGWGRDVATISEWEVYGDTAPTPDIGPISIDAPPDTVWSEYPYTPQATVENFESETVTFQVVCEFDSMGTAVYSDTVTITDLAGGASTQVSFADWTAGEADGLSYTMIITTLLEDDGNPDNDAISKTVTAVWPPRDVAPVAIITPPDFVWAGCPHIPRAKVANLWEAPETFDVRCEFDSAGTIIYSDVVTVTDLAAGDSVEVEFATWSAGAVDEFDYLMTVTTLHPKDLTPANDTISKIVAARKAVPDLDIQDYAGNLSANTMQLTGVANSIVVGSYVMVNPDDWEKNVDLFDGPGNVDLELSYSCTDLSTYGGGWTIGAANLDPDLNEVSWLGLGAGAQNILQAYIPNNAHFETYVGKVTAIGAAEDGSTDADEFTLKVNVVMPKGGGKPSSFSGEPLASGNHLYWPNFGFGEQGFNLYRSEPESEEFTRLNDETMNSTSYTDYDVLPSLNYSYKLGLAMADGREVFLGPLTLTSSEEIGSIVLEQNWPNPWADATEICYFLPKGVSSATLKVYDVSGKLVKSLAEGAHDAGAHTVCWDGTDAKGLSVSSGVYFYILRTEGFKQTKKMLLLR